MACSPVNAVICGAWPIIAPLLSYSASLSSPMILVRPSQSRMTTFSCGPSLYLLWISVARPTLRKGSTCSSWIFWGCVWRYSSARLFTSV